MLSRNHGNLFFGAGAGRCGTMAIANLLNTEAGVTCLHEGKIRTHERAGEKLLPFLTLQNAIAYTCPEQAADLLEAFRSKMPNLAEERQCLLGDVAYNYVPFLKHIPTMYPEARIFVVFRNGTDFVRSATVLSGEDETPIGWPPRDKPLSEVERFVSLGRWRPKAGDPWEIAWDLEFDHFERNAWLWAETNREILAAIKTIPERNLMVIHFEKFFPRLSGAYSELRSFLGIDTDVSDTTRGLLEGRAINHRESTAIGSVDTWSHSMKERFMLIAGDVMVELGYGRL